MSVEATSQSDDAQQVFAGRIDVLYAMGRHYLSLPFAVLCVPATLLAGNTLGLLPVTPLLLQMSVVIAAEQLTTAYRNRPVGSDPHYWARRYTFVSAIAGATWGLGALFWFVWGSFPAQAYLALAYLGMTATEFIARSAHRPAYAAHTIFALGPLIILLLIQGGLYATMTALLVAFFGAVLISYCKGMGRLIDESLQLRSENATLVVRLSREKSEAIVARDSAQASALAKSAFIANISHELRTPMNALLGMAQLLERADLSKSQADHVKVMLEAGRGLQTLLDDVIALTRDDDEQLEDEDCDPVQTARAVSRLLQPRAWEKRLRLTLSAAPDLPRVAADPRKVRQALLKIADNALKFTDRGLVDVRLDVLHDRDSRGFVRFTVSDTGHGVAADIVHLLFQPFTPGDSSYARKEQGAGLGLAVSKRIVEQAGGHIGFESQPGDGAQFWFTLPMSGQHGWRRRRRSQAEAPAGGAAWPVLSGLCPGAERRPHHRQSAGTVRQQGGDRRQRRRRRRPRRPGTFRRHHRRRRRRRSSGRNPGHARAAYRRDAARRPAARRHRLHGAALAAGGRRALPRHRRGMQIRRTRKKAWRRSFPPPSTRSPSRPWRKSVGVKALIEILQCYIITAEQLTNALAEACAEERWDDAARLAQDIVGAAGGLGLAAVTRAARQFAKSAREGEDRHGLRNAAQMVVGEHLRARKALTNLYPDVA